MTSQAVSTMRDHALDVPVADTLGQFLVWHASRTEQVAGDHERLLGTLNRGEGSYSERDPGIHGDPRCYAIISTCPIRC